jgi:gluconate kinase
MPASLVESQFAILEEPAPAEQAETLDATLAVDKLEETARKRLSQP